MSSHKADIVFGALEDYFRSIGGDIVHVCTVGTETSKSAIQTACRGLGINSDTGIYLSSLMPSERGQVRSLRDAYYGNEDKGWKPVTELVNQIDQYPRLLEVALGIEGLISRRGIHACFDGETLVTTNKGLKKIKDIIVGDKVLTHKNQFKTVGATMVTETESVYTLKTTSSLPLEVTGNHPFYVRKKQIVNYKQDNGRWSHKKTYGEPEWVAVEDLKIDEHFLGVAINQNSIIPSYGNFNLPFGSKSFWWLIGRYIGDGWTESYNRKREDIEWKENRVIICCTNKHDLEKEEITRHLNNVGFKYRVEMVNTTYKIHIKSDDMYEYLQTFGRYAHGKCINKDVFDLPIPLLESFIDGYIGADGHLDKKNKFSIKTVSKELAVGVMQLINKVYRRHASIVVIPPKTEVIEGRVVNSKMKYNITFTKDTRQKEQSFYEDGYIWTRLSKLEVKHENKHMYNLSVYDDNSYVVHGLIAHNCGSLVVNEPITKFNAVMKAPNGTVTTQYPLASSEYCGLIKYDLLRTKTCGMIQLCMEMLIEYGHMEWQGSLRATYDKYLHPDVIDSTSYEMWERLCQGELISAFQMDGDVGENSVRMIQPHSIIEASNANTVMRLMCEGKEQPLEKYARYKHDIQEWYNDMRNYGLNEEEISILEPLLLHDSGVCGTQESMMSLVMNERIANFDVPQANKIRKAVAKKKMRDIPVIKELFHSKGAELGVRKIFLDYIWNEQISLQLGYSFCLAHSLEYTWILVQQLNLIHYYPSIYWNTAVLLMESGAISQETLNEEDDKKEKTTNYGVVASAISNLQDKGVTIALPDINKADVGFIPNEEDNSIMFGMKGITTVNNDTSKLIMENRPYTSLQDFHERMVEVKREVVLSTGKTQMKSLVSSSQTINLIKAGAFDELENKSRDEILSSYLRLLNPPKNKLTASNISNIIEMGIVPPQLTECIKHHNFKEFIKTLPKHKDEESKTIVWYVIDCEDDEMTDYTTNYLMTHFGELVENRDFYYDDQGFVHLALGTSRKGSFEALHKEKMKPFTQWLNSSECIDLYNHVTFEEIKRNQMKGNQAKWEMESMNYYYSSHELDGVNRDLYSLVDFNELPEEPIITGFTQHGGNQYPRFELYRIAGTVLDRDRNKHTVTLLTQNGVVSVKFYSGQFSFYDKTLSMLDENTGKKVTVEEGWFKRGSLLLISGFRRGQRFSAKRYANSIYQHAVTKITNVCEDGTLELQTERANIE